MDNNLNEDISIDEIPTSYHLGQELNWEAEVIPVVLFVELPFWLMVPNCTLDVDANGYIFKVDIIDNFYELYLEEIHDSRDTRCCIVADYSHVNPEIIKYIEEQELPSLQRKCKTILRIYSNCNVDVIAAEQEEGKRSREAQAYLKAFCDAHVDIVNKVIKQYRLSTYNHFAYEVSPWDIPIWLIEPGKGSISVMLLSYAGWDQKPVTGDSPEGPFQNYELISSIDLQKEMKTEATAGEIELLNAINLMERGDYSGAVRRIATAIEAVLEFVLRQELLKYDSEAEVDKKLYASRNDFPGRLRQYQKLSKRTMLDVLLKDLESTRNLRHEIVHRAVHISFKARGKAQRSVDTGRWIFNWLENEPEKKSIREKRLALRSVGRHHSVFGSEITSEGVIVHKPNEIGKYLKRNLKR
jgi:hypothetical protein